MEYRFFTTELRVKTDENSEPKIVGYAAVFNKLSEEIFGFREKIKPGAFTKTIKKDDIRALVDHDSSRILGRNIADTLTLREDKKGLHVEIIPPDTSVGRDILVSLERGDITGMSFGFRTISDEWNTEDGNDIRTLKEVKLFDVSPVTYPAYLDTDVSVRSKDYSDATESRELWKKENEPKYKQRMKMQLKLAEI